MEQTSDQTEDVKWNPQSEVKRAGTPNLETQVDIIARAQSAAVMEAKGDWVWIAEADDHL